MTHFDRAVTTLKGGTPDYVPTFELEFQLAPEMFGGDFLREEDLAGKSPAEVDRLIHRNAEFMVEVYSGLGYSIIPVHYLGEEHAVETAKIIHRLTNHGFLLTHHGDGTFALPDGNRMYEFAYRIADDFDGLVDEARRMADWAVARNRRLFDAGIESFILCSDYCYNMGPFISPKMFSRLVTPFLARIVDGIRSMGGYAIKHTDGDIMPVLDQMLSARPHAIHSLDPMAGVDLAVVKRRAAEAGVGICGNVNCALMQTGTDAEVLESARYAMEHGKPGGGYFFTTSNVPFRGLPPERYRMILDFWKKNRDYSPAD